jgi:nicotinamide/nicotinate riboside kinase
LENWDCVEALNFDEFVKELKHLKRIGDISNNVSRYESDTKDQDLSSVPQSVISTLQKQLEPLLEDRKLILIDGFMLFHDPEIIRLFDLRIFVRSSYETLKTRRYNRSGYQTADSLWVDPPNYFDDIVYPAYAESHGHLFTNGDVESDLDQSKLQEFDILAINNDDGTNLNDALNTVCRFIVNKLQNAL